MSVKHVIEAWRDAEYRESLDAQTRMQLPENPAGEIELTDADLVGVDGGSTETVGISITLAVVTIELSLHYHCIELPGQGSN